MKDFRYDDVARSFDESLREILIPKVAAPEPQESGLERIARGATAFQGIEAAKEAARAGVARELTKAEVKRRLEKLMQRDRKKKAEVEEYITAARAAGGK